MSKESTTYYKFLTSEGISPYVEYAWPLPTGDTPGDWVEVEGGLIECKIGIHACAEEHLLEWLDVALYELEYDGERHEAERKVYGRRARLVRHMETWNEQSARLFAADCAEHVSRFWVAPEGCDWEPAQTILVARRFAFGLVDSDTAGAAAHAARAASCGAADAAYAASAGAADAAARSAAYAAFAYAASADAANAARATTREWQSTLLMQYVRGEVDIDAIRRGVEDE